MNTRLFDVVDIDVAFGRSIPKGCWGRIDIYPSAAAGREGGSHETILPDDAQLSVSFFCAVMHVEIVSLFDYSGVWSEPYREAGYSTLQVDMQLSGDVFDPTLDRLSGVVGVLAAPPCTDFAAAGARWFADKDADGRTEKSIALVHRTLQLIRLYNPLFWALENPIGRIHTLVPELGPPAYRYHPYEFGDPWAKTTLLWGRFNSPEKGPIVSPQDHPQDWRLGPPGWYNAVGGRSIETKNYRSRTSPGFARAFFAANRGTK